MNDEWGAGEGRAERMGEQGVPQKWFRTETPRDKHLVLRKGTFSVTLQTIQ